MTDHARITEIAEIGTGLIDAQLYLGSATAPDALRDMWVLGYCLGVFDALGRRAKLDQDTDGFLLLTVGFQRLLGDLDAGASQLGLAMDNQTDPAFATGNMQGGTEIYAWLDDREKMPMELCARLNARR